jgi:hypothetical protein
MNRGEFLMKYLYRTMVAGILVLGVTGVARAATLVTPLLHTSAIGDTLQCNAVNGGTRTISSITVDITVLGSSVGSGTCSNLAPGQFCQVTVPGPTGAFCKVTVAGSTKNVRAVRQVDNSSTAIASIVEGR